MWRLNMHFFFFCLPAAIEIFRQTFVSGTFPAVPRLLFQSFQCHCSHEVVTCHSYPSVIGAESRFSCEQSWVDGWGGNCCCKYSLFVCHPVCRLSKHLRNEAGDYKCSYQNEVQKPSAASAQLCRQQISSTCVTFSHKLRKTLGTGHT